MIIKGTTAPFITYSSKIGFLKANDDMVPDWLLDAMEKSDTQHDFDEAMSDTGAICTEFYGMGAETLDVWKMTDGTWLVQHADGHDVDCNILVADVVDFLMLQATFIAPLAQKIMAEDQYCAWREKHFGADPVHDKEPALH